MFGQAAKRQFNGFDSQSSSSGGFGLGNSTSAPFGTSSTTQTQTQTQQPSFGSQSTFGTSTINGNSSFGSLGNASLSQSQSSFFNSDVMSSPAPATNNTGRGPSYGLSHSQSAYDLRGSSNGTGNGYEHNAPLTPGLRSSRGAPSWTSNDRRFVPSHLTAIKQKSSFYAGDRTPERSASFSRRASTSPTMKSSLAKGGESPPSGVGGSSFGTPKPSGTKKQTHTITEEELPPTQSIYDSRGSPFSAARRGNSAGSGMRRSETFSSNPTAARKTLRATASFNHANTPRKMAMGNDGNLSVVVYGFPQHLTPSIVSHFGNFGEIMENVEPSDASFGLSTTPVKRPPPGNRPPVFAGRNWIKITYDNKASVIRALAEDGSQFAGQYVIGCKPYTPSQMRDFDAISASMLDSHDVSMMESDYQESPLKPKPQQQNKSMYPNISASSSERTLPRTTSMPVLNGAKRLEIRDGTNTVFKQTSGKTITNPKVKKTGLSEKAGWLSWTAKRAEELIFGYEV
ncbi:Nucleoporin NUP53 [Yarrowia sp. C11]|nr:Nucleoporin NUP53 [Yarrowia sp. E02]KAG5369273.1 Nucleoporin NUP53 [Yarrowia sp. C11]